MRSVASMRLKVPLVAALSVIVKFVLNESWSSARSQKTKNKKTHTTLAVSANGQVRDIPLSIRVLPFIFAKKRFATEFSTNSWTQKFTVSPEVENMLMNYFWPGNVRELRNVLQYASVRTTSNVITPADLPPDLNSPEPLKKPYKKKRKLKLTDAQVTEALEMASGNKRDAAKILGVSRSTLYRFFDGNDDINSL